jgi:hypothetical protein
MKSEPLNRRRFLRRSLATTSLVAGFSLEEQALLAQSSGVTSPPGSPARPPAPDFPKGRIGKLRLTRLICGGNLISGFAHSRDLIYVSPLLKHYFTDNRVLDTLQLCEDHGINTAILRLDDNTLRLLGLHRQQRLGKLQWIAQVKLPTDDPHAEIKRAIDHGAVGVYVHGGVGDTLVREGRVEALGKAVETIRQNGAIAGIAGHSLEVPKACEQAGLNPDFYLKTFNSKNYWSAGPMPRNDSVWEETPAETMAFMAEVDKPWIAYKVLGAGAIHPQQGFTYAFENGADFICVGMFDFQIAEDVDLARKAIARAQSRNRPWSA